MARILRPVTATLVGMLRASDGLKAAVADAAVSENLYLDEFEQEQILAGSAPASLGGREQPVRYPLIQVYCDKIKNQQREKFRSFSGTVRMTVELRVSHERSDELEQQLYIYADAVTQVLERNRGDWGQGMAYGGSYEIDFGPVKPGGRNYVQSAKILIDVLVSQPH